MLRRTAMTTRYTPEGWPGMNGRTLRWRRAIAAGVALLLIGALAGCGTDGRMYEEAVAGAESSLVTGLEITASQTAQLLAERSAVSEISADDIVDVFLTDARDYEASPPNPVKTRAVFDIVENADGSVTFSLFFKASVYRASGLTSTSQSRHTCGTLTGKFTEPALSIGDRECPPAIEEYAGDDSIFMPMTQNAEKYGAEIDTLP